MASKNRAETRVGIGKNPKNDTPVYKKVKMGNQRAAAKQIEGQA